MRKALKTNQLMAVMIGGHTLKTYHKTGEILLADVWRAGNAYRVSQGLNAANQALFIKSEATKRFIAVCETKSGGQPVVRKEGRGKNSKTFVSIHLAIYAAEYLSTDFHYEVIETFIRSKLLEWRDDSGDEFTALNGNISQSLIDRKGKENRGVFIQVAKMIKAHVSPAGGNWNSATADQLQQRTEIERDISKALKWGAAKTWPELKDFININFPPKP